MPAERWPAAQLKDVVSTIRNGTTAAQVQRPTPYPVSRIETISEGRIDWSRVGYLNAPVPSYELQKGDVLYSHINSLKHMGKVALFDGSRRLYHGMNLMLLRFERLRVEPSFCFRLLQSEAGRAHARREAKSAINQASLGQGQILSLPVALPPLPEQRRITEILDTLDAAISRTEQVIAKLQQMKQGLLYDLLSRGIDEHGELRDPERHPEQFKDSPLGRIPRGWEVVPLPALCRYQNGAPFPSSDYGSSGIALLRPGNLQPENFVVWDERHTTYLPRKWERNAREFIVGPGEVAMNLTAQSLDDAFLGRVCVTPPGTRCLLNQRIARFRVHGCDPMYFFWVCKSPPFRAQIDRLCQGTKVQHVYNRNLDSLLIQVPAKRIEQTTISTVLFEHGSRVSKEHAQLDKLRTLKHGLMDDLLTGRVRVAVPLEAAS